MYSVLRGSRWLGVCLLSICTGCTSISNKFTVDTSGADPLIYGPGMQPERPLLIPLEGFEMPCWHTTVKVSTKHNAVTFTLLNRLWYGTEGLVRIPIAKFSPDVGRVLAREDSAILYENLKSGLSKLGACQFSKPKSSVAELAAQRLQVALPRPYSQVLRTAYNYRVWNKEGGATAIAISVDLLPGMRLRVENSLPISPSGISSTAGHPSSFAAPTYIYFHALTGPELCDPGSRVNQAGFLCEPGHDLPESKSYVSAVGGLARLGLRQTEDNKLSGPVTDAAYVTSSLIDLLERTEIGEGAWRYWRLWMPVQRDTALSKALGDPGTGSPENSNSTPLLIAGLTLSALNEPAYHTTTPCLPQKASPYRCHSLRYRVVPVPEFILHVNGQREWVPIGTTLADVLADRLQDGFSARPYFFWAADKQEEPVTSTPFSVTTARRVLEAVKVHRMQAGRNLSVAPRSFTSDKDVYRFLRLQLVPGDEVTW